MLLEQNRLQRLRDFDILFKEGVFVPGELVTAKIWCVAPDRYPKRGYTAIDLKIGFIVSNKISTSAVKRNRVKRQMREVVRLLLKDERLRPGFHVGIMAKGNILGQDYTAIEASILQVLRRGGIMRPPVKADKATIYSA